jgi:multidrug efflux pump subunit AcrA (membrane-fusion protein)
VEVEETDFAETFFSLGRIEAVPAKRAVISSRVPGRVLELKATLGETVQAGADVVQLESRQPGDPPPTIMLKAPLSGVVTESQVRLGEPVDPEKALLEITDLSEVLAIAKVPEHQTAALQLGATAHIRVAAVPGRTFEGALLRFAPSADRESGTLDAIFRLPNPELNLRPHMRAEFSIVVSKRAGVLSVPREAVQGDAATRFVYVTDFDLKNAFMKAPVQVGAQNDRFVEISSGVLPGDRVVTRGAYALAFAGKGSNSLKEAMDAAHGHPHNEDGSEMTAEQRAAVGSSTPGGIASDRKQLTPLATFFGGTTVLLLVLLILALVTRKAVPG